MSPFACIKVSASLLKPASATLIGQKEELPDEYAHPDMLTAFAVGIQETVCAIVRRQQR